MKFLLASIQNYTTAMAYQEKAVAHINDLKDGEMKQVTVGETDVLLSRVHGNYYAVHGHCTHYGAPLAKGALKGKRVVCPWHHACFDVTTGKHLDPPGMDGLPAYEVFVQGDQVHVRIPDSAPEAETPHLERQQRTDHHAVLIGGGAAAAYAAQSLREEGYTGNITMITREDDLPYDRPNCSKEYLQDKAEEAWMPLRGEDFYRQHDIIIRRNTSVHRLDAKAKMLTFQGGETLAFDTALICTGGKVKTPGIAGEDFPNVFLLRSWQDSRTLRDKAKNAKKAVVIGSSFIGMEGAWSLQTLGCQVAVVSPEQLPFEKIWGDRVGAMFRQLHEENGVQFHLERNVHAIEGNGKAERVVLDNGEVLTADLVLIGVGVKPATDFVEGLKKAEDGGIVVDQYLHAGEGIYAAGDVAQFPYQGGAVRIEHWRVACQQGHVAGRNMAGREEPFHKVPYFWSAQQGQSIRYVGYVKDYDEVLFDGNVEEQNFIACYIKGGELKAALGMGRDQEMAAIEALMLEGQLPAPAEIRSGKADWISRLRC